MLTTDIFINASLSLLAILNLFGAAQGVLLTSIIKYSRNALERNSTHGKAVLFEIRFFVIACFILWFGAILRYAVDQTGSANTNLLVPLGASVLVYALGYLKMRRPERQYVRSG